MSSCTFCSATSLHTHALRQHTSLWARGGEEVAETEGEELELPKTGEILFCNYHH